MCRIAGYLGAQVALSAVLTEPAHGLRHQGRAPRELPEGMLSSDGYGFAWTAESSREPARYRSILPVWSDANLDTLAPHIRAHCLLASTRTAEDDMPVSVTNTPPFLFGALMAVHNGAIKRFHERVADDIRAQLRPHTRRALHGNTDSEYMAAWLADTEGQTLELRTRAMMAGLRAAVLRHGTSAQLNLIAAEGDQLVAVRESVGQAAPSLYFTTRGSHGVLVASEPMNEHETWTRVPEGGLLSVTRHRDGEVRVVQGALSRE